MEGTVENREERCSVLEKALDGSLSVDELEGFAEAGSHTDYEAALIQDLKDAVEESMPLVQRIEVSRSADSPLCQMLKFHRAMCRLPLEDEERLQLRSLLLEGKNSPDFGAVLERLAEFLEK